MNTWERFDETLLPNKEDFYSSLSMENITDDDYDQVKKVFKEFKMTNLGDHHDLHVQGNTLLPADAFQNFRNKFIEAYELDPTHFLPTPTPGKLV